MSTANWGAAPAGDDAGGVAAGFPAAPGTRTRTRPVTASASASAPAPASASSSSSSASSPSATPAYAPPPAALATPSDVTTWTRARLFNALQGLRSRVELLREVVTLGELKIALDLLARGALRTLRLDALRVLVPATDGVHTLEERAAAVEDALLAVLRHPRTRVVHLHLGRIQAEVDPFAEDGAGRSTAGGAVADAPPHLRPDAEHQVLWARPERARLLGASLTTLGSLQRLVLDADGLASGALEAVLDGLASAPRLRLAHLAILHPSVDASDGAFVRALAAALAPLADLHSLQIRAPRGPATQLWTDGTLARALHASLHSFTHLGLADAVRSPAELAALATHVLANPAVSFAALDLSLADANACQIHDWRPFFDALARRHAAIIADGGRALPLRELLLNRGASGAAAKHWPSLDAWRSTLDHLIAFLAHRDTRLRRLEIGGFLRSPALPADPSIADLVARKRDFLGSIRDAERTVRVLRPAPMPIFDPGEDGGGGVGVLDGGDGGDGGDGDGGDGGDGGSDDEGHIIDDPELAPRRPRPPEYYLRGGRAVARPDAGDDARTGAHREGGGEGGRGAGGASAVGDDDGVPSTAAGADGKDAEREREDIVARSWRPFWPLCLRLDHLSLRANGLGRTASRDLLAAVRVSVASSASSSASSPSSAASSSSPTSSTSSPSITAPLSISATLAQRRAAAAALAEARAVGELPDEPLVGTSLQWLDVSANPDLGLRAVARVAEASPALEVLLLHEGTSTAALPAPDALVDARHNVDGDSDDLMRILLRVPRLRALALPALGPGPAQSAFAAAVGQWPWPALEGLHLDAHPDPVAFLQLLASRNGHFHTLTIGGPCRLELARQRAFLGELLPDPFHGLLAPAFVAPSSASASSASASSTAQEPGAREPGADDHGPWAVYGGACASLPAATTTFNLLLAADTPLRTLRLRNVEGDPSVPPAVAAAAPRTRALARFQATFLPSPGVSTEGILRDERLLRVAARQAERLRHEGDTLVTFLLWARFRHRRSPAATATKPSAAYRGSLAGPAVHAFSTDRGLVRHLIQFLGLQHVGQPIDQLQLSFAPATDQPPLWTAGLTPAPGLCRIRPKPTERADHSDAAPPLLARTSTRLRPTRLGLGGTGGGAGRGDDGRGGGGGGEGGGGGAGMANWGGGARFDGGDDGGGDGGGSTGEDGGGGDGGSGRTGGFYRRRPVNVADLVADGGLGVPDMTRDPTGAPAPTRVRPARPTRATPARFVAPGALPPARYRGEVVSVVNWGGGEAGADGGGGGGRGGEGGEGGGGDWNDEGAGDEGAW